MSRIVRYTWFALALLCALPVAAQQAARRPLKVDDFARVKAVGDPQLSPDGEWIAYTVGTTDLAKDTQDTDVWMTNWAGTTTLRLTSSPDAESSPRWSPDGKYLSFTSSRQEGRGSQVWLLDRRGGEAQRLTEVRGGVSSYSWSPDSRQLIFLITDADADTSASRKPQPIVIDRYRFKSDGGGYLDRKRSHIYIFDIAAKKTDTLTVGDFEDGEPVWSPDGKYIAFSSKREGADPDRSNNSDIYVMEAKAGATPRRLTNWTGADSGPITWSPDGTSLLYQQGSEARLAAYSQETLALIPVAGGTPRLLFRSLDRDVSGGRFSADGAWIYFLITDDLKRYLARGSVTDERIEKLAVAPRVLGSFTMSANGRLAATITSAQAPFEVHAFEANDFRRVTSHNDALLNELKLADVEGISYKTKDGAEVHATLFKPVDYENGKRYPTLFRIHGGPNSQNGYEFDFERQLFAAHGYAVVAPNYRGSNGRGRAWKEAIFADWGTKETIDVLAGADHVVKSGIADPDRLGIGGWSYGCITTDYTIATDTRFKAAVCGAGSALQLSMYGSDQYIVQYEQEIGLPWKNPDAWLKISWPFFEADRIKTPTLYMGGQNDFNVPIIGGEQMYQALKSLGVPTQLVIYPNEKHGLRRPSFVKDRYDRYIAWYDKYLKPPKLSTDAGR